MLLDSARAVKLEAELGRCAALDLALVFVGAAVQIALVDAARRSAVALESAPTAVVAASY